MNKKALICGLTVALLVTGACAAPDKPDAKTATSAATPTATAATPAAAAPNQAEQDFTLVNATGVEIDKLYISPHGSDDWEEDILGQDTLPDGKELDIKFSRTEKAPLWDLRIEDNKENAIEWENLNLLEISKLTITYKDGKATAHSE